MLKLKAAITSGKREDRSAFCRRHERGGFSIYLHFSLKHWYCSQSQFLAKVKCFFFFLSPTSPPAPSSSSVASPWSLSLSPIASMGPRTGKNSTGAICYYNKIIDPWCWKELYICQALADQCKFRHDCSDCRRVERFRVNTFPFSSSFWFAGKWSWSYWFAESC